MRAPRRPAPRCGLSRPTARIVTTRPSRIGWSGRPRRRPGPATSSSPTRATPRRSCGRSPIPPCGAVPATASPAVIPCRCGWPWSGTASTATAFGPSTWKRRTAHASCAMFPWSRRFASPAPTSAASLLRPRTGLPISGSEPTASRHAWEVAVSRPPAPRVMRATSAWSATSTLRRSPPFRRSNRIRGAPDGASCPGQPHGSHVPVRSRTAGAEGSRRVRHLPHAGELSRLP
jgi:hypothetical protein